GHVGVLGRILALGAVLDLEGDQRVPQRRDLSAAGIAHIGFIAVAPDLLLLGLGAGLLEAVLIGDGRSGNGGLRRKHGHRRGGNQYNHRNSPQALTTNDWSMTPFASQWKCLSHTPDDRRPAPRTVPC